MGIYKFSSYIRKKYSSHIVELKKPGQYKTDYLFIDGNIIVHDACQEVFGYGNYKDLFTCYNHITEFNEKVEKSYSAVMEKIEALVRFITVDKALYIGFDGSCPVAKANQQRERRTKTAISSDDEKKLSLQKDSIKVVKVEDTFSPNSISPATSYMYNLSRYIKAMVRVNMNTNARWKTIQVLFSSSAQPGETEHKILNYIRSLPMEEKLSKMTIMSNDADLIVLCLCLDIPNINVLQLPNQWQSWHSVFQISDIKKNLPIYLSLNKGNYEKNPGELEDIALSYNFLVYFAGNDFVKTSPMFNHLENVMDFINTKYSEITKNGIKQEYSVIFNKKINVHGFNMLIKELEKHELRYINRQIVDEKKKMLENKDSLLINTTLLKCVKQNGTEIDFDKYRKEYYKKEFGDKFNESDVTNMCKNYVRMLIWTFYYYTVDVPSWNEYYAFHYTPFMVDISKYLDNNIDDVLNIEFQKGEPPKPYLQLISIFPLKSKNLLPLKLRGFFDNLPAELKPFYPSEVKIDYESKSYDYQGVVLLPYPNMELIAKHFNIYSAKNNLEDQNKNKFDKLWLFKRTTEKTAYFSSYGNIEENYVEALEIE